MEKNNLKDREERKQQEGEELVFQATRGGSRELELVEDDYVEEYDGPIEEDFELPKKRKVMNHVERLSAEVFGALFCDADWEKLELERRKSKLEQEWK